MCTGGVLGSLTEASGARTPCPLPCFRGSSGAGHQPFQARWSPGEGGWPRGRQHYVADSNSWRGTQLCALSSQPSPQLGNKWPFCPGAGHRLSVCSGLQFWNRGIQRLLSFHFSCSGLPPLEKINRLYVEMLRIHLFNQSWTILSHHLSEYFLPPGLSSLSLALLMPCVGPFILSSDPRPLSCSFHLVASESAPRRPIGSVCPSLIRVTAS